MPNILDAIQVSGASYDLKDKNAPSVSSLTQSEYDNLPSTAKTSNTFFVITDAQGGDLSNYYTKSETNTLLGGKADTATTYTKTEVDNAITGATSTKQDTLVSGTNIKTINNTSLLGSGNIDIQGGGGGKAVSGGTNISVTTGETADTVSCTLPLTVGSSNSSLSLGVDNSLNNSSRIFAIGDRNSIGNLSSNSLVGGMRSSINYNCANSIAFGYQTNVGGKYSCSIGSNTKTSNDDEAAFGRYNASNTGSTDADKTRFSVGNGTDDNARHNAFEIRQNGDIYISSGGTDIKLQDHLGGGGGGGVNIVQTTGTSTADVMSQDAVTTQLNNKANKSSAVGGYQFVSSSDGDYIQYKNVGGSNIGNGIYYPKINGKDILTSNNIYARNNYNFQLVETSAITTAITSSSTDAQVPSAKAVYDQMGGLKLVKLTQSAYDALSPNYDSNTLYVING